jgi:L-lactate dehydrogenase (cytochrome)
MVGKKGEYYHGGALDGISNAENKSSFRRCRLIPRVMRDVSVIAPQTTIFGVPSALPIYISPASNALLGHPEGELNLTRGVSLPKP